MFCSKCGKEIKKGTKFCANCGEKAEVKEEKKEVKKEKVEAVKVETKKEEKKGSNGLGIAGMIIGIVSIILSFLLTILIIVFPIVGLVLSCISKGKKGFKITGIITNALAIVLSIVLTIIYAIYLGSAFGNLFGEIGGVVKSGYPYGTWTCVPYTSLNLNKYDYDNIMSNDSSKLTVLTLNTNNTYKYGPYVDSYKNYYKGKFTYELEVDKNNEANNKAKGYSFILAKGEVDEYMMDGVRQSTDNKSLNFEMELFKEYGYDKALIMFTNTYNMYMCER